MKRIAFAMLLICVLMQASAYESLDIDLSFVPKTHFSEDAANGEGKGGALLEPITATKNKRDVPLPDRTLLRGFERFTKTDAFGDSIPDDFLFYRQSLSESGKAAYDEIYKAVMTGEEKIQLLSRVKRSELSDIANSVYFDNPELFWWTGRCYCNYNSDGEVTHVRFAYIFSGEKRKEANRQFLSRALPIIFYAALLDSEMDKIKYVHDYLCRSIEYDEAAYKSGNCGGKLQTAYSAIVEYKTVCAGYARAFAYYMQQLGIPCVVLYSKSHAWNLIEVGGYFYQMDVTWNDGSRVPKYFNLLHSEMQSVRLHSPTRLSAEIVRRFPSESPRFSYKAYFKQTPIGYPYTYEEFSHIAEDIENPIYARVYVRE